MTGKGLLMRLFLGVSLVVLFLTTGGVAGASSDTQVQWQARISITFTAAQVNQPDWQANASALQNLLSARVATRGASMRVTRQARTDGGLDLAVDMNGKGNLQQFKEVVFDDIEPLGGFLGGPASLALTGEVRPGEKIPIVLESNPATGFLWEVGQYDAQKLRRSGTVELTSKTMLLGAPMKQTVTVEGVGEGATTVVLLYRRSWEKDIAPTRKISIQAARLTMLTDLSDPAPLQGVPAAAGHTQEKTHAGQEVQSLPGSYDWRALGKVPPIRNQGACGSCWAFGTAGAFESALMIQGGLVPNLSEQFLVSCNTNGWGCNGGWFAHDYHWWKLGKTESQAGAVEEAAFPYVARNVACNGPYAHPYQLSGWSYIGSGTPIPSAAEIKDAIYNYGPVAAAVCVGSAFQNYTAGVFKTNEASACGSSEVNHAIVLVGWNDADNTWILRNSWGTGWGEGGYMRIARGVSNVGYGANYVNYSPTPGCFSLNASANPGAGGSASAGLAPNCSGTTYSSGTVVTLTAYPSSGYQFAGWSGDANGSTNPTTVTMDGNKNITANFTATTATVEDSAAGVQFNGWRGATDSGANGGAYRVSSTTGESAIFKFTGTSVKWITRKGPDQGKASVTIGGVNKGTFDLYSSSAQPNLQLTFGGLSNTTHTIVVTVLGTKNTASTDLNVVVDGFIVGNSVTQEGARTIQYGSWVGVASSNASGGTYRYSLKAGATATFAFSGTSVTWIAEKCPGCGRAEVYVDGVDKGAVDLYNPSTWKWKFQTTYGGLGPGTHTIQVKVLGTKNPASSGTKVTVDAFRYSW